MVVQIWFFTVYQPLYILASNSFLLPQVYIILLMLKESYNFRNYKELNKELCNILSTGLEISILSIIWNIIILCVFAYVYVHVLYIYHPSIDLSIYHLYLSSLSLTSYHCHIISVMCWRQLILVHKGWQIKAQKFCKLLRVMLIAWKWPWRDYLGHANWKIMQIRHFFSSWRGIC